MKRCPTCRRAYADETLSFCLDDGAVLLSEAGSSPLDETTRASDSFPSHRSQAKTEVLDAGPTAALPETARTSPHQRRPTSRDIYSTTHPPKTQNTALVVGLTVIATLILLALGGIGVWVLSRGEPTSGTAQKQVDQNQKDVPAPADGKVSSSATPNSTVEPSKTGSPVPPAVNPAAVREQVTAVLNGWTSASRERNLDKHLSYYADTLETYYSASNVNSSRVRTDRARAYELYNTLDIELSDIKVTPDPSGERATATFDKTWTFEGNEKYSSGSVHQKIWLAKVGGRWRITGEKDLQVYYVNRER